MVFHLYESRSGLYKTDINEFEFYIIPVNLCTYICFRILTQLGWLSWVVGLMLFGIHHSFTVLDNSNTDCFQSVIILLLRKRLLFTRFPVALYRCTIGINTSYQAYFCLFSIESVQWPEALIALIFRCRDGSSLLVGCDDKRMRVYKLPEQFYTGDFSNPIPEMVMWWTVYI